MNTNPEYFAQRNRRYWHIDGINEIISGILFIFLGLLLYAKSLSSADSRLMEIFSTAQNILLTAGTLICIVLVRWLKERFTYPRSGYISYPSMTKKQFLIRAGISIGVFFVLSIILIFSFLTFPAARSILFIGILWLPFLIGIVLGAYWVFLGMQNDLKHFYLMGGVSLMAGLGLGYLSAQTLSTIVLPFAVFLGDPYGPMPYELISPAKIIFNQVIFQGAVYFGVMGFVSLVSGIFVRQAYVRQNPVLPEEQ